MLMSKKNLLEVSREKTWLFYVKIFIKIIVDLKLRPAIYFRGEKPSADCTVKY